MTFKLMLVSFLSFFSAESVFAANCPDLSGYWEGEAATSQNQGRVFQFVQTGCDKMVINVLWVDINHHVVDHSIFPAYQWNLNGTTCDPYHTPANIDCRKHTYDSGAIYTFETGSAMKTKDHGICNVTQWNYSLDGNRNLVDTDTVTRCADGFSGTVSNIIQRTTIQSF